MPSGKVHDMVAVTSIPPVIFTGYLVFSQNMSAIFLFTFFTLFTQLMFGPDLDAQSSQYKRWGIFRWIWIPYRKFFSHRSRLSHGLLFGPIIRCLYLIFWIIILLTISNLLIHKLTGINMVKIILPFIPLFISNINITGITPYFAAILAGLFLGAAIHTITDKTVSFFKNLI